MISGKGGIMSRTKLQEKRREPEATKGRAASVSHVRSPAHAKHGKQILQPVSRASRRLDSETGAHLEKPPVQLQNWIVETLKQWSWTLRFAKFAMATGTGFLINQTILAIGILTIYHTMSVPGLATSSFVILGLDLLALGTGDTVAFVINERFTVKNRTSRRSRFGVGWLTRWFEYQITAMMGNLVIMTVQIVLLVTLALSPLYGEVAGAIVSYPTTYIISMRLVWRVHPFSR
jgi:putative flippase GtrA